MFIDKTGRYAETIEELYQSIKHGLTSEQTNTLAKFELVVQGLVEKGYIKYVEGKGYALSKGGVREVRKSRGL